MQTRIEHDSMGEIAVPAEALWGAQTERARQNFHLSGLTMPRGFISALALIKSAAAHVNAELAGLDGAAAIAIRDAANAVAEGLHDSQFPLDIFQTGSGTSTNMNANEVIATLASRALGRAVHPNDEVNCSQSSNDVIPTAIHLSAALAVQKNLLPALQYLAQVIEKKRGEVGHVVKTGRTHLMDAMPLSMDQELSGWQVQIEQAHERVQATVPRLLQLAIGGTAVGTGINAPASFGREVCGQLKSMTGLDFTPHRNAFTALSCQDTAVELSGQLRGLAVTLTKIANDLRWMNSGPLAGLAEISLPSLQPGSSIMPGKVNPVIPEAVAMVAAQVVGHDATIAMAGQSGNFQLNVMLPVIAHNLLQAIEISSNAARALGHSAIAGLTINNAVMERALARNPILVTALNRRIGYEKGAAIAKRAYAEGRPVIDVATEDTGMPRTELEQLLDPRRLIKPE